MKTTFFTPRVYWAIWFLSVFFCGTLILAQSQQKSPQWPDLFSTFSASNINKTNHSLLPTDPLWVMGTNRDTTTFTLYPTSLHGVMGSDAAWFDYDNDGKLDIIASGWDDKYCVTKIYHNENGNFVDINAAITGVPGAHGIAWGDFNNDGYLDLAIEGEIDSNRAGPLTKIYRNDHGTFVDINAPLIQLGGGTVTWIDIDNDGQLDLLITGSPDGGQTYCTKLYRNDNGNFRELKTNITGVWGSSLYWGDYDNDGDLDLLLTGFGGTAYSQVYRNDGPAGDTGWIFTDINAGLQPVNAGIAIWGDYDNDGYLDIFLSGDPPGWNTNTFTTIYRNMGNGQFVDIHPNLPQLNLTGAAWGDYDNDGDLDLALEGWTDNSIGVTKILRNDGNGVFTDINADLPATWWGSVAWGDFDNDGRLDLLLCGGTTPHPYATSNPPYNPITAVYHNNFPTTNTRPVSPSITSTTMNGAQTTLTWDEGTDNQTPLKALTYNLRLGRSSGNGEIISPTADQISGLQRAPKLGNTGHLKTRTISNLPDGTYYWSVQTIDNEYAGSTFTPEQTFSVGSGHTPTTSWQLVSLPYQYDDAQEDIIFPSSVSPAYAYFPGHGYGIVDPLLNGPGYWVRLPSSGFPVFSTGNVVTTQTIPVSEGWNLIGSISSAVNISTITSDPPGMATSRFLGYTTGYTATDQLIPGHGYWVKVDQDGSLTLSSAIASEIASRIHIILTSELPPPPPEGQTLNLKPPIPKQVALDQNYPNPFNPSTVISYSLPERSFVRLTVYNILGSEVRTLQYGYQDAGYKSVTFNATDLPSGIYFYRLQAGKFTDTKKTLFFK